MPEELSPSQAASRLGTTTRSVQRWIAHGKLPARRVGGRWRVANDAIDVMLRGASAREDQARRRISILFIANRGEIARRIARTCERLGIRAIAPDTEGADAVDLLDAAAVVDAARAAGADAVHPGFGFLAESPALAVAVTDAGLRWVGPPASAIEAMGDKATARRLAARLGIPVVPGYDDPDQSDAALAAAATGIGLPLLVKPAAGGGGKGMRIVRDLARLDDALSAARREARAAFGDERLILERLIEGPRHVEIQLLFDARGTGVHLGERDCSIQRRHQKILEETPSPGIDAGLRARLGREALRLASEVGYQSAGTCEFLVDDRGRHFFLEMNTRLQVEHPVTEAVTGRDLVADQLRIAAGEPLVIAQTEVHFEGHAVEVRLYAEDAEAGFLPATGRVEMLRWPRGPGLRVDAGIDEGTEIGDRFDPLLAKLIAHGRDRFQAFNRLTAALDETLVMGVVTNLRFLRWLVRQPVVLDGQARIDSLDRIWPPNDWPQRSALPDEAWATAARALAAEPGAGPWSGGWRVNAAPRMRLESEDEERTVPVAADAGSLTAFRVGAVAHVDVGGRSTAFRIAAPPEVEQAARSAVAHSHGGAADLTAPMPGSVLAIHATPGDLVRAGDPIATLEAMKMEHVVAAPIPGRLAGLDIQPGDQVTRGQTLGVIVPEG